jgi:hypothetical protein
MLLVSLFDNIYILYDSINIFAFTTYISIDIQTNSMTALLGRSDMVVPG